MATIKQVVLLAGGKGTRMREMTESENRISRPRQLYNGRKTRKFLKISDRITKKQIFLDYNK